MTCCQMKNRFAKRMNSEIDFGWSTKFWKGKLTLSGSLHDAIPYMGRTRTVYSAFNMPVRVCQTQKPEHEFTPLHVLYIYWTVERARKI